MKGKKIKILYTIPNFKTAGSGIALMKLIGGLNKDLFEPHIMCLYKEGKYFRDVVSKSGVPVHIYPYTGRIKPYSKALFRIAKLSDYIRKNRFDIVFSYHYAADYIEAIASKFAGAKFLYVKKNMSWKGSSYNGWRLKSFFADKVIVQNMDMKRLFFKNKDKAILIPIGVDTREYYPRKKDEGLIKEFGIKNDDKVVVCVAQIVPKKGIDILLDAVNKINEKENNLKFFIIGDYNSEYGLKIKRSATEQYKLNNVLFTGKRYDVHKFYSIADIFVLPSVGNEGAPIVIQEAMASGVIVITTDTPGNKDQIKELPDQLIPVKDSQVLALKIEQYLNISEEKKSSIIKTQEEIVNERYSLLSEIKNHENLYLLLMKNK